MKRLFVETDVFRKIIDHLQESDLEKTVKAEILKDPRAGDIVQGTGGIRKIRIPKPGKGKSGGFRVLYLDLPKPEITYLFLIYDKSVMEDISPDQKRQIKMAVEEIKNEWN